MTQEEAKAWALSLKPGDAVVHQFYHDDRILHIKKVTPSGIIRTQEGPSFKLSYGGWFAIMAGGMTGRLSLQQPDCLSALRRSAQFGRRVVLLEALPKVPLHMILRRNS